MPEDEVNVAKIAKRVITAFMDDMDEEGKKRAEKSLRELDEIERDFEETKRKRDLFLSKFKS